MRWSANGNMRELIRNDRVRARAWEIGADVWSVHLYEPNEDADTVDAGKSTARGVTRLPERKLRAKLEDAVRRMDRLAR